MLQDVSYFVDHLIRVTANKNKKKLFYLVHFLRLKSYHLSHVSYHKPNLYFCPSSLRVLKRVLLSQLKAAVREKKVFGCSHKDTKKLNQRISLDKLCKQLAVVPTGYWTSSVSILGYMEFDF